MNIPIIHSLKKVGLPLVVTTSRPHLCFLVDTGSSHNVLFSYVLTASEFTYAPRDMSHSIMGIDGTTTVVNQIETTLSFDEKDVSTTFSVLDATNAISQIQQESSIQIHGILGIPFLTQNEWILDFKRQTINTDAK